MTGEPSNVAHSSRKTDGSPHLPTTEELVEKPLSPITHGIVLLVGTKSSNFDNDIKEHRQVVMWDGDEGRTREIPSNCQAIFITRFLGHSTWDNIVGEARKRHITIFNTQGTGRIAEQVRQLLGLKRMTVPGGIAPILKPKTTNGIQEETKPMTDVKPIKSMAFRVRELVDVTKTGDEQNNHIIEILRKEGYKNSTLSIKSTIGQMLRKLGQPRKYTRRPVSPQTQAPVQTKPKADLVQMFDEVVITLQLIRDEIVRLTDLQNKLRDFVSK